MVDTFELVALVSVNCNGLTSKLEYVLVIVLRTLHLNPTAQYRYFFKRSGHQLDSILYRLYIYVFCQLSNKGHVEDNINSAVVSFVERLSSSGG